MSSMESPSMGGESPPPLRHSADGDIGTVEMVDRPANKLCGYLNKLGSRGPLKTSKRRWFVFSENTCKLFYYKNPQDTALVGEIDISKATFSFEVTNMDKPGLFFVSTPDKTYELEAKDREACLFWLQELQMRRKEYSRRCTAQLMSNSKTNSVLHVGKLESGLLRRQNSSASQMSTADDVATSALIIPVERPAADVGEESADGASHRNWSFSNLKDQVSKKVHRHISGHSNATDGSPTHKEDVPLNVEMPIASSPPESDPSSSPKKNSIRWRFSNSFRLKDNAIKSGCKKCEQLAEDLASAHDEVMRVQDETETSRELIRVLQAQLDDLSRQRDTLLETNTCNSIDSELLIRKDNEISSLVFKVRDEQEDNARHTAKIKELELEISSLKEQLAMYQTAIEVKDQVLVQLTDKLSLFEDAEESSRKNSTASDTTAMPAAAMTLNVEDSSDNTKLKDTLQAFQLQNKFLNKEILELNHLRKESEERQDRMLIRCSEWEAKYYQIQSKYLLLLNELHTPRKDNQKSQEIVSQLFDDALFLQVQPNYAKAQAVVSNESDYDEFGFARVKGSPDNLHFKATESQKRSKDLNNLRKDPDIDAWRNRWETFIVNIGNREINRDMTDFKLLLRSGVPYEHKGTIWKKCVDMWVKRLKERLKPGYYQKLLDSHRSMSMLDAAAKQIELDLLRTLPNNKHYETLQSDGVPRLRRVLLAYSWHNAEVGYCQGLNRLAAIALLFMNEEDAFWCLVTIIECIMPQDYYSKTLIASQVDQRVLKDLLAEKLPRLNAHFEKHCIDLSLFTFNWFLCIFVDNVPPEVYLRIWDVYLLEGTKVLFRYALAFFKIHEEEALQITDAMGMNNFIRLAAENSIDIKRLSQVAFDELNPFRMRVIKSKRSHHMQVVKAELEEFEKLREECRVRSEPRMDYVDSEEEEG